MTTLSINDVIKSIKDLPSLPAIVVELLSSIDQEEAGTKLLAEKLSRDQALTAKTLRLANSSFYGMSRKVTTIQQAIAILGFNTVRTLVTAAAVTGSFSMNSRGKFSFKAFWRHATATALCAKALAKHLRVNQDQAFIVGLLHDIGRLVLVTQYPQRYDDVITYRATHDCYLFDAERKVLGVDHTSVGQALAVHWKFPLAMQKAITEHHALERMENGSLTMIAHLSDAIAHALDLTDMEDDLVPPLASSIWAAMNLSQDTMTQIFRETESQFEEACQILAAG